MRRFTGLAIAAGAAALMLAAPAGATHSATDGGRDFAVGSGTNLLFEVSPYAADLRVSAHAVDDELPTLGGLFGATDVTGHVVGSGELPNGEFRVEGEVTCLKVVGNQATIKYRFKTTSGSAAPPPGWGVQVFVEDNGRTGNADGSAADLPQPAEAFEPLADQCELPRGPFNPIDSGNFVVHDVDVAG